MNKDNVMSKISKEDIAKLLELIAKAYEKAGRKMTSATMITDVNEDGTLEAEELLETDKKPEDLN